MDTFISKESYKVAIVGDQHLRETNPRCRKDDYVTAILNKIEYILMENDIFIGLGDLFDKPDIGAEALNRFLNLIFKYKRLGKYFYTIYGNHDIYKYNTNLTVKTSLGICLIENAIKILDKIAVHNIFFEQIPFVKQNPVLPDVGKNTFLLGHFFYESFFDPNFSLTTDMLNASKAIATFLGHDHEPHNPVKFNETVLLRPGSLCRNTADKYNFGRIPNYYQITVSPDKVDIQLKSVAIAESTDSIFILKNNDNRRVSIQSTDVSKAVEEFSSREIKKVSTNDILKSLGATEDICEIIRNKYKEQNFNYF